MSKIVVDTRLQRYYGEVNLRELKLPCFGSNQSWPQVGKRSIQSQYVQMQTLNSMSIKLTLTCASRGMAWYRLGSAVATRMSASHSARNRPPPSRADAGATNASLTRAQLVSLERPDVTSAKLWYLLQRKYFVLLRGTSKYLCSLVGHGRFQWRGWRVLD